MDVDLNEDATVALDASGNGTIGLGPRSPGESWTVSLVSVKVSSNTNEATCQIFNGDKPVDTNFTDGTFSGSSGDSTDRTGPPLYMGNRVWAVWSGGDPDAIATINVTGTRTIP